MRRSKAEKDEWRQRAIEAEQDLVSFKSGTEDTMLELIRAKERIHQLEEQMQHHTSILVAKILETVSRKRKGRQTMPIGNLLTMNRLCVTKS